MSSGKTLIGEAAAAVALAQGKRAIYTTPLKALSNQKLSEFCGKFGSENVGIVTGNQVHTRWDECYKRIIDGIFTLY